MPGLPDANPPDRPEPAPARHHAGVVVSSRVRLARNVAGFPFVSRATVAQRGQVIAMLRRADLSKSADHRVEWIDLHTLPAPQKAVLFERNLISRQLVDAEPPSAVAIVADGSTSVMVNEEDHLRLQALCPGLALTDALRNANRIDDAIEASVDYAFSPRWGYLTACPTNVGCGIRLSAMLHLPALRLTNELERVRRAAKELHLAIRGFHGEGSESAGDLYQVSNQVTLGLVEEDLLEQFECRLVPRLVEYELHARDVLLNDGALVLEDRVHRAVATLRSARLLGLEESMKLLSRVRLGLLLGRLDPATGIDADTVARLLLEVQPGHLQVATGLDEPTPERVREARATLVRTAFAGHDRD